MKEIQLSRGRNFRTFLDRKKGRFVQSFDVIRRDRLTCDFRNRVFPQFALRTYVALVEA